MPVLPAVQVQWRPGRGVAAVGETEHGEVFLHPFVAVEAGYDLLADVAALGEVDGPDQAGLQRIVGLAHLAAEGRRAAGDPQGIPHLGINLCRSRGPQRSDNRGNVGRGDHQETARH